MPTEITGEHAARAMFALLDIAAAHTPGGWRQTVGDGARLITSGLPLATFNGVFRADREPAPADVAEYAARAGDLPWSVFSRSEPTPGLIAAGLTFGRTTIQSAPIMTRPAGEVPPVPPGLTVHTVGPADRDRYVDALAAGFEAPRELFDTLISESFMVAPGVRNYLIEAGGEPVATAFGVVTEDLVGVFNVATPAAHRRRGYGRVATEAVLRDGFAAGAVGSYLISSEMGLSLYHSMGFRTVETWTYLTAE